MENLCLLHGVLAPNAKLRREIIPTPPEQETEPSTDDAHAQGAPVRLSWARLLKRVFDIDIDTAPLRRQLENHRRPFDMLRTGIEDPPAIVKILSHLRLPTCTSPRALAQRFDLLQTI